MEIIFNVERCKDIIVACINKYGFASEHNYDYFMANENENTRAVFISCGEESQDNLAGVLSVKINDANWKFISEPLAKPDDRAKVLLDASKILFDSGAKNILVEISPVLRKKIIKLSKKDEYKKIKIGSVLEKYNVPIISLKNWDSKLEGPEFTNLRKTKNRYYRNYKIKILAGKEALNIDYDVLKNIVIKWKEHRKSKDNAYYDEYLEIFRKKFSGTAHTMVLEINDSVCAVASCFPIPRNNDHNSSDVYYALNIHDYSIPDLGDFLTTSFFDELKRAGFDNVDFGSSDENLLKYKKKFKPSTIYTMSCFYIKKNNQIN